MSSSRDTDDLEPFAQQLFWWGIVAASALVLGLAAAIEPDARGYGTHTQLGLPPCGFLLLSGSPCPGCGLTTAFAHAIRGNWLMAASSNPLGLLLFLVVCACIPLGITAVLRGWSFNDVVERFALNRWGLALAGCAVAVWVVRFAVAF